MLSYMYNIRYYICYIMFNCWVLHWKRKECYFKQHNNIYNINNRASDSDSDSEIQ